MTMERDETIFTPLREGRFRFRCHREISCFTKCCAKLRLILTPYDILRMKNRLKLASDLFLEEYTDTKMDAHPRFPVVTLKMRDDENRKCPFVTSKGCRIYEDRPGACRIYPLGRAALKVDREKDTREKFFVVQEGHCRGFQEEKEWSLGEWMANEGVDAYNAMNDQWLEIITSRKGLGKEEDIPRKIQMFYMASYNLDKFRRFLFQSSFFNLFEIEPGRKDQLALDDTALMKFAFAWLKFSLFGEISADIRPREHPVRS
ncbi:MAG: YkgJ family cysteine cluster protein [Pseudomonadota bacterium]